MIGRGKKREGEGQREGREGGRERKKKVMKTVTLQVTLTSCSSDPYILSTALLCTIRVVWQFFASAALTWTCAIGFYLLHVLFSKVKSSTPKGLSWIKWAHILCWGIASGNSMLSASSRLQYNTHCYPL